jgi:hypothetical protein
MAKIKHRIPTQAWTNRAPEPISERYQAEVDVATAQLARRYAKAQASLERARTRHAAATRPAQRRELWRLILLREAELAEIAALMQPGTRSNRDGRRRRARHEAGGLTVHMGVMHPRVADPD